MAYSCDDVTEDALLSSSVSIVLSTVTDESAPLTSTVDESALAVLAEAAVVTSSAHIIAPGTLYETAVLTSSLSAVRSVADDLVEDAVLSSTIYPLVGGDLYETATLSSIVSSITTADAAEIAILGDEVSYNVTAITDLTETATLNDLALSGSGVILDEMAVITSAASTVTLATTDVDETAVVTDTATGQAFVATFVDEAAVLDTEVFNTLYGLNDAVDDAYVRGIALLSLIGEAWVALAKAPAMSRYEGLSSAEFVNVEGRRLGLSELGWFELTNDGTVESVLALPVTDFDDPQRRLDGSVRKHVVAVYAHGESDAPYQVRVNTDDGGVPVERLYGFYQANGEATRNTRCLLGKLVWARNWQFAFINSDPHTLREGRAQVQYTSRRV